MYKNCKIKDMKNKNTLRLKIEKVKYKIKRSGAKTQLR